MPCFFAQLNKAEKFQCLEEKFPNTLCANESETQK